MSASPSGPDLDKPLPMDRGAVLLPCAPDQFRDFIAGLLGKPQTIERSVRGPFTVTKNDIENLHHLIEQRVSSQNESTLIQFTCRIVYDDESSVLLNSFSDFVAYKEVKPLISCSAHPSWTYLIKFQNKLVLEKQQIDISFGANRSRESIALPLNAMASPRFRVSRRYGGIFVRISHTDRTWGTDIEALLIGQLQTLVHVDSKLRQFVRKYSGTIGFGMAVALLASLLYTAWRIYTYLKEATTTEVRALIKNQVASPEQIAKLARTILQYSIDNPMDKVTGVGAVFVMLSLIGATVFGATLSTYAESFKPSFVVLTAKAEERRNLELGKDQNNWSKFIMSMFGGLVLSVLGNYLFYLILTHYLR